MPILVEERLPASGGTPPPTTHEPIDWGNDRALAIDGFTVFEVLDMALDTVALALCTSCGWDYFVLPSARDESCPGCGECSLTSPLVKLGLLKKERNV